MAGLNVRQYPCGIKVTGPIVLPEACPEHGVDCAAPDGTAFSERLGEYLRTLPPEDRALAASAFTKGYAAARDLAPLVPAAPPEVNITRRYDDVFTADGARVHEAVRWRLPSGPEGA
jgi:hypothetical protein